MGANTTTALAAALGDAPQQLFSVSDVRPDTTPWGPVAAVLLCLLPILFLLVTTLLRPLCLNSSVSLPLSAALLALIRLAYLSSPPLLVLAHVVVGSLEGLVPLSVIFGAVLLFEAMDATGCLNFLMANVRCLSAGSPIAGVFLIGWAFAYTISGVGGFATPMALAAPMLVSLGHDPLLSLVTVVGLNGLAAHLGSVGMAVWFGFKSLQLTHAQVLHIGLKSAAVVGACSFVIAPAAASFLVPWRDLVCDAAFVVLSIASAVVPTVLFAIFSPEFPLVAGGLISMLVTWLLVKYGIGLKPPCRMAVADIETAIKPTTTAPDQTTTPMVVTAVAANSKEATKQQEPGLAATTVSSSSSSTDTDKIVSPFEIYARRPLPSLTTSAAAAASQDHTAPAAPAAAVTDAAADDAGDFKPLPAIKTHLPQPHADLIARRSRSLVAAAAAVGAITPRTTPRSATTAAAAGRRGGGAAGNPGCIFRCSSCAAEQQEMLAAAAAAAAAVAADAETVAAQLHRQFSAPPAAIRASAAAAAGSAAQEGSPEQQQQQPDEDSLLPALSLVNHSTGHHIVITGLDKLSSALKLLLHPSAASAAVAVDRGCAVAGPTPAFPSTPHGLQTPPAPHAHEQQQQQLLSEASLLRPTWTSAAGDTLPTAAAIGDGSKAATPRCVEVVLRTLPIWLTVLLLLVTHVPALKLQDILRSTSPAFTAHLGTLGSLSLSPALVLQLQALFTQAGANWKAELLYEPFLVPFVVVSAVTLVVFRRDLRANGVCWQSPFVTAWRKVAGTVPAMLGALVLAQLMAAGGRGSPAFIIAYYLTSWMGRGYLAIAGFLGALGSFVSGSVMGSNMTQGAIQAVAAERLGVPVTGLLAVQVAGACAGKMVCISSILSAKVVLSELDGVRESEVIRRTGPLALLFVVLAQLLGLLWTAGGLWPDV